MNWNVTYRREDGTRIAESFEAENRNELFRILEEKQIKAIHIEQGRPVRVGPRSSRSVPRLGRVLWAAAGVLLLGCAAWWLLVPRGQPRRPAEGPKETVKAQPRKPVQPVQAPRPKAPEAKPAAENLPKDKRRDIRGNLVDIPKNPWGQPIPPELEYKPLWEYTPEDYAKIDPGYLARHEAHKKRQAAIPWKTDADRQLSLLLFAKDGNTGLLTPFNRRFKDQFLKSLETPIIAYDDDPPELKEQKRQMNDVKVYLKERMDAGEDIVDILNSEYRNAQKLRALRQNLQEELRQLEKTAKSVQEVKDYIDAANKMLDEQGASHVGLPLVLTRRRLERQGGAKKDDK